MVVDVSDSNANVMWELGNAMARNKKIILVSEKDSFKSIPFDISQFPVFTYSYAENNLHFIGIIEQQLSEYVKIISINDVNFDARRLLKQGESNSAVIMAFKQLEIFINGHLPLKIKNEIGVIAGINLFKLMKPQTEHAYELVKKCDDYRTIRNRLVHTEYSIPKKLASEIINTITDICHAIEMEEIVLGVLD